MTRITYTIHTADLLALGYRRADMATYEDRVRTSLSLNFTGAEITVESVDNVSGATPIRVESDENEDRILDRVRDIANRTLESL